MGTVNTQWTRTAPTQNNNNNNGGGGGGGSSTSTTTPSTPSTPSTPTTSSNPTGNVTGLSLKERYSRETLPSTDTNKTPQERYSASYNKAVEAQNFATQAQAQAPQVQTVIPQQSIAPKNEQLISYFRESQNRSIAPQQNVKQYHYFDKSQPIYGGNTKTYSQVQTAQKAPTVNTISANDNKKPLPFNVNEPNKQLSYSGEVIKSGLSTVPSFVGRAYEEYKPVIPLALATSAGPVLEKGFSLFKGASRVPELFLKSTNIGQKAFTPVTKGATAQAWEYGTKNLLLQGSLTFGAIQTTKAVTYSTLGKNTKEDVKTGFQAGTNEIYGTMNRGTEATQFKNRKTDLENEILNKYVQAGYTPQEAQQQAKTQAPVYLKEEATKFYKDNYGLSGTKLNEAVNQATSGKANTGFMDSGINIPLLGKQSGKSIIAGITSFGINKNTYKEAVIEKALSEGATKAQAEQRAQKALIAKNIFGSAEIGANIYLGASTEYTGNKMFSTILKDITVKENKAVGTIAKKTVFPLMGLGVYGGAGNIYSQSQLREEKITREDIARGAIWGGASASLLGVTIASSAVSPNKITRGLGKTVDITSNFIDPYEKVGDITAKQFSNFKTSRGFTGLNEPVLNIASGTKVKTITPSQAPIQPQQTFIQTNFNIPTQNNIFTQTQNSIFTPVTTRVQTPTDITSKLFTNIFTPTQITTPTQTPTKTTTKTEVPTITPTPTQITTPTDIFTPISIPVSTPLWRLPPPALLPPSGFGSGGSGRGGRSKGKNYVNELNIALGLTGTLLNPKGGFTIAPKIKNKKGKK